MARRYTAEELLHLRESPLVVKPDNLPPVEEWMGYEVLISIDIENRVLPLQNAFADACPSFSPLADPANHKKNPRDQIHQTDLSNRRPSLFESRHIPRASNSGMTHLTLRFSVCS